MSEVQKCLDGQETAALCDGHSAEGSGSISGLVIRPCAGCGIQFKVLASSKQEFHSNLCLQLGYGKGRRLEKRFFNEARTSNKKVGEYDY